MLVEVWPDAPPESPRLVPGLFVHVALHVAIPQLPAVPAEALVSRGERLQLALVQDRRLHFVDVVPGLNDGRSVQIREGVGGGEVVALSPPTELAEGAPVDPVAAEQQPAAPQRAARAPPPRAR